MYIFFIIIHVLVCLFLILVILLQAGRGGGMYDIMGGAQPSSVFGTQTNDFMIKATEVCAVLFVVTSLVLGIMSTQRGKSVMERHRLSDMLKTAMPVMPAKTAPKAAATAPVPAPMAGAPATAPAPLAAPSSAKPAPAAQTAASPASTTTTSSASAQAPSKTS